MITELSKFRDIYEGGAFNTKNPLKYKQTKERFSALEDVLKKRNADPTEFVSDSIRTGTLGGKKLSSQERRELANRLAIVNMYKTGDRPSRYWKDDVRSPSDLVGGPDKDIMKEYDALRERYNRRSDLLNKKNFSASPQNIQAIRNMSDSANRDLDVFFNVANPYSPRYRDMPITNSFQLENIIDRIGFGMKSEHGRGFRNYIFNQPIKDKFRDTDFFNQIIKKYNITDKNEAEIIYKLLPEWEGTVDDLINVARMI